MQDNRLLVHSIETFGTKDGPGIRLVLFLQGCNWKCVYCHNPDTIPKTNDKALYLSLDDVLDRLKKCKAYFKDKGGLTVSGGEPTLQAHKLVPIFKTVQQKGYHTALDTNGSIINEYVKKLYRFTDLVLLDVKHIDDKMHQKLTGASNKNTLKNLKHLEEIKKDVWLRYVLVPGWTDQEKYLIQWAQTFKDYKCIKKVEILPYHKLGEHKYKELGWKYKLQGVQPPNDELKSKTLKIFSKYLDNVVIS